MIPESIRAVDDARGSAELFPVYQATVSADPLTSVVAVLAGDGTRSGGCGAVIGLLPKPSEASAAVAFPAVPEIEKLAALGVFSVTAPPSIEEEVPAPFVPRPREPEPEMTLEEAALLRS